LLAPVFFIKQLRLVIIDMPRNSLEFSRIYVELLYSYSYSNPLCIHYLVVVTPGCIHEREVVTHWCIQHWGIDQSLFKDSKTKGIPSAKYTREPWLSSVCIITKESWLPGVFTTESHKFPLYSPWGSSSLCPSPPDPFPCPHFFPLCPPLSLHLSSLCFIPLLVSPLSFLRSSDNARGFGLWSQDHYLGTYSTLYIFDRFFVICLDYQ
jgi:hypothetical protein